MKISLAVLLAFVLSYLTTQTKSPENQPKTKMNAAYLDQSSDALEAVDRLFEIQDEPRSIFIPARLEAEKYIAKAARLANTPAENNAQDALSAYFAELTICRIATESSNKISASCKGGRSDQTRVEAFAAINGRHVE